VLLGNIQNDQSLNRYAYCNGQPVSNIDPFGLCADNNENNYNNSLQLIENISGDLAGYGFGQAGQIVRNLPPGVLPETVDNNGLIGFLPKTEITSAYQPLQSLGYVGAAITAVSTGFDLYQTWSNPKYSTLQKIEKSSIQLVGTGLSVGAGVFIAGVTTPESGPAGILAGAVATVIVSTGVTEGEQWLENKFGL